MVGRACARYGARLCAFGSYTYTYIGCACAIVHDNLCGSSNQLDNITGIARPLLRQPQAKPLAGAAAQP